MELRWKDFLKQIIATTKATGYPLGAGLELTARCNFQCKMCYVCKPANDKQAQARELTAGQWIHLAQELRDAGVFVLTLTGGEVFIRPDFQEIYEELSKMGFILKILSNGSMITQEIIEWLSKIPPHMVSITLYGESRDTYQAVTGHADGYDRTIRAIDGLMAAGIATSVRTTFIRDNVDNIESLYKIYLKRGLKLAISEYITLRRDGCNTNCRDCRLSPGELVEFGKKLHEIYLQEKNDKGEDPFVIDDSEYVSREDCTEINTDVDPNDAFRCGAGKNNLWITWDGRMTPCGLMDQPYAAVLDKGISEAWKEIQQKCRIIPACYECSDCVYRSACIKCPARLYLETGFYDRPAPYLCEIARLRSEYLNSLNLERSR